MVVVVPSDEGAGGDTMRNQVRVRRVRYAPASWETLAYRGTMVDAGKSVAGLLTVASLVACQAAVVFAEVREAQADLVHAHWWVPGGISAWLASMAAHRPFVVTLHGTDVAILKHSKAARKLARIVLRKAAAVTAVSRFLAHEVATVTGLDAANILIQPMPLDVARYARSSRGGAGVVTVGRLVQQKNIAVVLEAVAILNSSGRTVHLKVVGDGPERRSLEHRAKQLGIGKVTQFVGTVTPDAIPEAMADADVFAFPAQDEGLGLAAVEAFLLGIPVVASGQGGGVTDIVPAAGAGRLIDAIDASQMAHAIQDVLDDPESRRLAAARGQDLKRQLSPTAVASVFEGLYERALYGG
jgi:glycosyltransferase involved in cell wall biosynthesis